MREVAPGTTPLDIANSISPRLAAAVVVARIRPLNITAPKEAADDEAKAEQKSIGISLRQRVLPGGHGDGVARVDVCDSSGDGYALRRGEQQACIGERLASGGNRSLRLNVAAADPTKLQRAQDEATALLRMRRNVKPDAANNFEVDTNETMTRTFNNLSNVITAASFGICLLSLVVGGIGILNIMLVSVTERTREIGIRKALGAKRRRILGQFTLEAVTLSLFGGVLGLLLGLSLASLGRWALGFPMTVPAWAVALALTMSSGVGLVFGVYPAARAAALDPVEAMRSE